MCHVSWMIKMWVGTLCPIRTILLPALLSISPPKSFITQPSGPPIQGFFGGRSKAWYNLKALRNQLQKRGPSVMTETITKCLRHSHKLAAQPAALCGLTSTGSKNLKWECKGSQAGYKINTFTTVPITSFHPLLHLPASLWRHLVCVTSNLENT